MEVVIPRGPPAGHVCKDGRLMLQFANASTAATTAIAGVSADEVMPCMMLVHRGDDDDHRAKNSCTNDDGS